MCGIAGIWKNSAEHVLPTEILAMSEAIQHRGPDDVGHMLINTQGAIAPYHFTDADIEQRDGYNLALANRRLSIIDLTPQGHQPMTAGGCTIVYNGEIYNYLELKKELITLGHVFISSSDTEVLLHAYLEWREECLAHLNGMFAFAIWDEGRRTLFCARDRLGIKPFYYYFTKARFTFASEIRCILKSLDHLPDLDERLVFDFLGTGLLDHQKETFFNGILRLQAGHYFTFDGRDLELSPYWTLPEQGSSSNGFKDNSLQFQKLFVDSVRLRLRSDVTNGCCLSGGLDSSAIVCVASRNSPQPMKTFTARYADRSMDEGTFAKATARHAGANPIHVQITPENFWRHLPELVLAQEEPFGGPSIFSQWTLMQTIAANKVKVILDGQGGDEILCGYAKYFYFWLQELWRQRRTQLLAATLCRVPLNFGRHLIDFHAAKRYLPARLRRSNHRILRRGFTRNHTGRAVALTHNEVKRQQEIDITKTSLPILLRYEDKNSMAHSIEARVPFLDHRLVEFAFNLPIEHILNGAQAKYVMRIGLADFLPTSILKRRSKLGFGGTFASWVADLQPQLTKWLGASELPIDRFAYRKSLIQLVNHNDPSIFPYLILDQWLQAFGYF